MFHANAIEAVEFLSFCYPRAAPDVGLDARGIAHDLNDRTADAARAFEDACVTRRASRRWHHAERSPVLRPSGSLVPGHIIGPCAIALVLALQTAAFPDVTCEDAKVDLANNTLPIPGEGPLPFVDGVACPPDYDTDPRCEWRSEIELDLLTTPESRMPLRVLQIFESHARGSGSWTRVIAYRCERGRLLPTFSERFECGASVVRAFGPRLLLSMPEGGPKYAHGCQARSTSKLYTWSPPEHTYRLDPISGGRDYRPTDGPQAGALLPREDVLPPSAP